MSQSPTSPADAARPTARELTYTGGALLLALASFFERGHAQGTFSIVVLSVLAPVGTAVALIWRRMSGRGQLRVLGFTLDQIAGIVALVALVLAVGGSGQGSSQLFAVIGALAMTAASWAAGWIPPFASDFVAEPGVFVLSREIRVTDRRPGGAAASGTAVDSPAPAGAGSGASSGPAAAPVAPADLGQEPPFWFAVPQERPAFHGGSQDVAFTLLPGQWWLAVAQNREGLLVRHDDGREGVLRDLTWLEIA